MKNDNISPDQLLVTKAQIARRYGVSERTIQEWMLQGLPYYKLGYIVRFSPQACDQALVRFMVNTTDQSALA